MAVQADAPAGLAPRLHHHMCMQPTGTVVMDAPEGPMALVREEGLDGAVDGVREGRTIPRRIVAGDRPAEVVGLPVMKAMPVAESPPGGTTDRAAGRGRG